MSEVAFHCPSDFLTNFIYWPDPSTEAFDEKKVSRKGSKHIWVDSVFDGDSKYVKNSIGCHASFWKSSLFFQRSFTKPTSKLQPRKVFASEKLPLCLGCRTPKTAGPYLVPIKNYSKNGQVTYILKWVIALNFHQPYLMMSHLDASTISFSSWILFCLE